MKALSYAGIVACILLGGCSTQQLANVQADAAKVQVGIGAFCQTDQPVVGTVATLAADGTAVADPALAPVATVTGFIVQDVNGVCAGMKAVPAPAPGTKVVVPSATP